MALKSYKFRFYPTPVQRQQLEQEFGAARFIWNHCLGMRSKAYKRRKESMNAVSLSKHVSHLKTTPRYHWLKLTTAACLTQKLIDMDKAFTGFFKQGMRYPRFKKKHHAQSIRYQLDQRILPNIYRPGECLKIPKLGALKLKWSQLPNGLPKMATVSKAASGEYYVSFSVEEVLPQFEKTNRTVGVDVGIKDVLVTSHGDYTGAPKYSYQYAWALKKAQRQLKRMQRTHGKVSNRQQRQRIKIAKLHQRVANCRKDFLHKLTTWLVKTFGVICLEDLNIKGMLRNRKLSRAIADIGLYELKRQIIYKAQWYGKYVQIISRWYPSSKTCSACGMVKKFLPLRERVYRCEGCGHAQCRDLNAGKNIEKEGLRLFSLGAGLAPCGAINH